MTSNTARILNALAGAWLFISAFVWQHSRAEFANSWIVGIIIAAVALIGLAAPAIRYLNTLLGIWLLISVFALPAIAAGTRWNNFIVSVFVIGVSLAGSMTGPRKVAGSPA